jgi:hypothetical protein
MEEPGVSELLKNRGLLSFHDHLKIILLQYEHYFVAGRKSWKNGCIYVDAVKTSALRAIISDILNQMETMKYGKANTAGIAKKSTRPLVSLIQKLKSSAG